MVRVVLLKGKIIILWNLYRFVSGKFGTLHEPTVGALFLTKKISIPNYIAKFEIWDTAGQEKFHALIPTYYRNAQAAVVVFDITNYQSFERAQKWVNELLERASSSIVIALCGNKADLEDSRKVSFEEAVRFAEQIGSFYTEVSAKINQNIEKLFQDMAIKLPKKLIKEDNNNIKLNENDENTSQNRCGC